MSLQFYTFPLSPERLMNKQQHPKCRLDQSVASHLHLIITTAFGELPADENFGCSIWENDFDNLTSRHKIKEIIIQSLLISIQKYEPRLSDVKVELSVRQEEIHSEMESSIIKKRFHLTITGNLNSTNQMFSFQDSFYTAPLSYY